MSDSTIVSLFNARVHSLRERPALRSRDAQGVWQVRSWSDYGAEVRALARALAAEGVGEGSAVATLSGNRAEYSIVDLAIVANGAVSVPIYHSSSPEQVKFVLDHSGASFVFVEDDDQSEKLAKVRGELDRLRKVVVFSGDGGDTTYDELVEAGRQLDAGDPAAYDNTCADVQADDLACLIYTSGTTGPPKGVMLSHRNVTWTARSLSQVLPIDDYRVVSFLPMAHIAERMVSHYLMVYFGGETWFGSGIETLRDDIAACRPTVLFAVPRVFEKLESAVSARLDELEGTQGRLARGARNVGERVVRARQGQGSVGVIDTVLNWALDRVVMAKLREQLGLDAAEMVISGAAPITERTLYFFHALGLPIAEVYGQTEGCGPTSLNPPDRIKIGSVGPPIPGVDVRIADDGEVLVHGGNVFRGYFQDDAATREALVDGWLHSGDLGELDEDGYLTITGRKKDLIITAGGKNVSPQNIESSLKSNAYISQAVAIGDGRKFVSALITLDADAVGEWAAERDLDADLETASRTDAVRELIAAVVEDVNAQLSKVEQVKKFTILDHDFTEEAGELTPTLKVKRNVVEDVLAAEIESMYE